MLTDELRSFAGTIDGQLEQLRAALTTASSDDPTLRIARAILGRIGDLPHDARIEMHQRPNDVIVHDRELEALVASGAQRADVPAWAISEYAVLKDKLRSGGAGGAPAFPCVFARKSDRARTHSFLFASSTDALTDRERVKAGVLQYLASLKRYDRFDASLMPLLIMFKPEQGLTLTDYHQQAWAVLQWLHEHDPEPWPWDIPTDPEDSRWSFCFAGTPLFANFTCPAYARNARRIGDSLTLVMQPRANFDFVAGDSPRGRAIRQEIRRRLADYEGESGGSHDELPPLDRDEWPEKNRDWKQMAPRDGDVPADYRCPLHIERKGKR